MGRKEGFMLAHKIDATSKIDVDLVQHGKFGQLLQECEFVLRFKEIPWATATSWISVHWGIKVWLLDFFGSVLLKKEKGLVPKPDTSTPCVLRPQPAILSHSSELLGTEVCMGNSSASFCGARALPLTAKQAMVQAFGTTSGNFADQRSLPRMGCAAGCLSQAELPARNPDLMKSNALTLQWPFWLHGAQLRQRYWSLAVTKCFLLLAFYF